MSSRSPHSSSNAGLAATIPTSTIGWLSSAVIAVVLPSARLAGTDSAGAAIGFWQPNQHHGFTERGEHGTPYWFESHTTDYAKSIDFYTRVLGARIEEVGTGGDPDAGAARR